MIFQSNPFTLPKKPKDSPRSQELPFCLLPWREMQIQSENWATVGLIRTLLWLSRPWRAFHGLSQQSCFPSHLTTTTQCNFTLWFVAMLENDSEWLPKYLEIWFSILTKQCLTVTVATVSQLQQPPEFRLCLERSGAECCKRRNATTCLSVTEVTPDRSYTMRKTPDRHVLVK